MRLRFAFVIVAVLGIGLIATPVAAEEITVGPDESIQEAINKANSDDTVVLEGDTYEQQVTINRSITVDGQGATLVGGSFYSSGVTVTEPGVEITNLEILRYDDHGVLVQSQDVVLTNVTLRGNGQMGITSENSMSQVTIDRSEIINNGDDGVGVTSSEVSIEDSYIASNFRTGADLLSETVNIANTTMEANRNSNLFVKGNPTAEVTVAGSGFNSSEFDRGIGIEDGKDVNISNVTAFGNSDQGIEIFGENILGRSTEIFDVVAENNGGDGLLHYSTADTDTLNITSSQFRLNGGEGADIAANALSISGVDAIDNGGNGIFVGSAQELVVSGVTAEFNENSNLLANSGDVSVEQSRFNSSEFDDGLRIEEGGELTVENVTSVGNSENGVYAESGGVTSPTLSFSDVVSENNGDNGVDVAYGDTEGNISVSNSRFISNSIDGIYVATSKVNISGTISNQNEDDGVDARAQTVSMSEVELDLNGDIGAYTESQNVELSDVSGESNTDHGLEVVGDSTVDVYIMEAKFNSSGGDGIRIEEGEKVVIQNSTTNGNQYGIDIFGSSNALSRNVTVSGSTSNDNTDDGLYISGTSVADEAKITDSEFNKNGANGIDLNPTGIFGAPPSVEVSTIAGTVLKNNAQKGVIFGSDTEEGSSISRSTLTGNGDSQIENTGDGPVDATGNWWGSPDGPDDGDCVGDVDCSDPLAQPPGSGGGATEPVANATVSVSPETTSISEVGGTAQATVSVTSEQGVASGDVTLSIDTSAAVIQGVSPSNSNAEVDAQSDNTVTFNYTDPAAGAMDIDIGTVTFEMTSDMETDTSVQIDTANFNTLTNGGAAPLNVTSEAGTLRLGADGITAPLISKFDSPPQNTGELDSTLYEDLDGDGDGTSVGQTVDVFGYLIRGNDLGLTSTQASKLDWDEDGGDTVDIQDIVELFGKQIRS